MNEFTVLCQAVKSHMTRARDAPTEAERIIQVSCLEAACNEYLRVAKAGDYGVAFTRRIAEVTEWVEKGKKKPGHLF